MVRKSCQGCGALLAGRLTMKVLGKKTVLATPACCFAATTSVYPESAIFCQQCSHSLPRAGLHPLRHGCCR